MTVGAFAFAILTALLPGYLLLLVGNIGMLYWPLGQPKAPPPIITRGDWVAAARRTAKQLLVIWLVVIAIAAIGIVIVLAVSG